MKNKDMWKWSGWKDRGLHDMFVGEQNVSIVVIKLTWLNFYWLKSTWFNFIWFKLTWFNFIWLSWTPELNLTLPKLTLSNSAWLKYTKFRSTWLNPDLIWFYLNQHYFARIKLDQLYTNQIQTWSSSIWLKMNDSNQHNSSWL